jgi:hypothetical protein
MPSAFLYPNRSQAEIWRMVTSDALSKESRRADHLGAVGRLSVMLLRIFFARAHFGFEILN